MNCSHEDNMPEGMVVGTPTAHRQGPDLVRALSVHHAAAVVVGTVIGSGIFLVPAEMMQAVGSAGTVYLAWLVGGVLSLAGALTYAELAALKPETGGEYIYMRDGYGPLGSFLYAWTYFVVAKPGSMATIATGFVRILSGFTTLSFLGQNQGNTWKIAWPGMALAIAAVAFITFINYIGVKRAGEFQFFFTLLKVAIIVAVVVLGFSSSQGTTQNFHTTFPGARGGFTGFMVALLASLWAYDGWNLVTTISGEVKDPQRNLPIALIAGMLTVAALYMAVNGAVQYCMPAAAIATSASPALDAIRWIGGGFAVILIGMAVAMLATLNGSTMTGARVPFAVARDGYFFSALAKVHPRFHTPSTSLVVQGLLAVALLGVGASFQQLFSLTLAAEWLFYLLAASTVFIFRYRSPDAPRAYKVWGYPVVPALFIIAAAVLLYRTFADYLQQPFFPHASVGPPLNSISVVGLLSIAAGIPVYYWFAKRRKQLG
jgi:basic amino acid/polyamine antiporter, APA family